MALEWLYTDSDIRKENMAPAYALTDGQKPQQGSTGAGKMQVTYFNLADELTPVNQTQADNSAEINKSIESEAH